jgi:hypothetical protein
MFQQSHRTASNKILLIAQMEDGHLLNMIGSVVSWAERATRQFHYIVAQTAALEQHQASDRAAYAQAQRKMYGLPELPTLSEATSQYAEGMNMLSGKLQPYLLEAWTRALSEADQAILDELRARWRKVVGRSAALPDPERVLLAAPEPLAEDDDQHDYVPL